MLPFAFHPRLIYLKKLLKPLLKKWRQLGIPIVVYLDDGIGEGKNSLVAKRNSLIVLSGLIKAGFFVNEEKSSSSNCLVRLHHRYTQ